MSAAVVIPKPRKIVVPLAAALAWRGGGGFMYQEKLDGRFAVRERGKAVLCGELMPGALFHAFDVMTYAGEDVRPWPYRERLRVIQSLDVPMPLTGSGGEFLEHVLARGGEGIVAKELAAPFGAPMWAAKRVQVFYCRVIATDASTGGVWLADRDTNEPRGKMPLRGNKFEQVRVGSVLKVEAFGLTAKGLLREARPDKDRPDSWLVQP